MSSSSTLIETVNINLEDFSESFLTCATCLCPYDQVLAIVPTYESPLALRACRSSAARNCCPARTRCVHCVCRASRNCPRYCLHELGEDAVHCQSEAGTLRCPLCRELNALPRTGVSGLPPSFLVNQLIGSLSPLLSPFLISLIDLMKRQRRDFVPKCSAHPDEHLLFCETCVAVFCPLCSQQDACKCEIDIPSLPALH
jgi:tripartite motif-containing protein 2/3